MRPAYPAHDFAVAIQRNSLLQVWSAGPGTCLLPCHGDADSFLRRDEVIEALSVFSNGELDAFDATRKLVPT